jgi:hypothetical protein
MSKSWYLMEEEPEFITRIFMFFSKGSGFKGSGFRGSGYWFLAAGC